MLLIDVDMPQQHFHLHFTARSGDSAKTRKSPAFSLHIITAPPPARAISAAIDAFAGSTNGRLPRRWLRMIATPRRHHAADIMPVMRWLTLAAHY